MGPRSTDATVAVAVRRLRGDGMAAALGPATAAAGRKRGMRRGGGSRGDMEGPRHAGHAYAGERVDVRHDRQHPPFASHRLCDPEARA